MGDDPRDDDHADFPGMHYTMGGLWVDFKQATNIPGIFAAGECEYQYHGANRLGANSLVSCIYGGGIAGPNAVKYARGLQALADGNGCFEAEKKKQEESNSLLMNNQGTENPFRLWQELGEVMTKDCTVIRHQESHRRPENRERHPGVSRLPLRRWHHVGPPESRITCAGPRHLRTRADCHGNRCR